MAERPDPPEPLFAQEVAAPADATPAAGETSVPRGAFAALLLGNVVLAIGPWFVRMADVGPIASGFWRLLIAVPFLFLVARGTGQRIGRIRAPVAWMLVLAAFFFAADLAAWHVGILRTKLANATLFGNVSSFFFAAYGFFVARALPGRRQALALMLAGVGVVLLLGRSYELSPDHLVGDLLCLFAGLAYTGYMIVVERARTGIANWPLLALSTAVAAAALLPAALWAEGSIWPHRWGPLLALAIGSQVVGQGLIVYGIGVLPPVVVGLSLLSQPLVGASIGFVIYGERLAVPDYAGALAIAVALVLVRQRETR